MDGWTTGVVASTNGGLLIEGLGNLSGKTVGVLLDDAWQLETFEVVAGRVILPEDSTGKNYAVGLLYEGLLDTFEVPDNIRGTGMATKRRWLSLTTRLLNSALPEIYGQRAEDRTPATPMGVPETVREGLQDVEQSVTGFTDGSVQVVMNRPYPVQVLAFFGDYQVEER